MKTTFYLKNTIKAAFMASALFLTSCLDDNSILEDDGTGNDGIVTVSPTNKAGDAETQYSTTATAGSFVSVSVNFSVDATERNMERLYITKFEFGSDEGPQPYDITLDGAIEKISTKADGSIDLDDTHKETFAYSIDFPAPATANGTVQYVIWATKSRGDFRDLTDDNVYGEDTANYAVITIGEGVATEYSEFTTTVLAAPASDLNSESFVSVFNGSSYIIEDFETAALWDFGYHYGSKGGASFYSSSKHSDTFDFWAKNGKTGLSLADLVNIEETELNNFYFATSSLDWNNVKNASDLDQITKPSLEYITGLEIGNVIEFQDQYGNKGLIKITDLEKGDNPKNDYITFDIKVQASAIAL